MNYWQLDVSMRNAIALMVIVAVILLFLAVCKLYDIFQKQLESQRKTYRGIIRMYSRENTRLKDELNWLREEYRRLEQIKEKE